MVMDRRNGLDEQTHLWSLYHEGIDYQIKSGLRYNIPKYIDFYEGRQWPAPTENTKNLPRPVVNIVKMICRSKKSSILSTPVRILYKSYSKSTDTDKLNDFAQSIQKEMNQEGLDRTAIDDGIKKGSYFYHYYWDKEARGVTGCIEGGVRCEIIDPLNIFFANPREQNEQKQKWILISTPMELSQIRQLADKDVNPKQIKAENEGNEGNSSNVATLLTRYFKIDGEVWCERGTKDCIVNAPFKLTPNINYAKSLLHKDNSREKSEISSEMNASYGSSLVKGMFKLGKPCATLYPIVCGCYERREGSIYGLSEVEGIIPNQKAINFNIAMTLLNSQQCAWGKYIALPNALKGQTVTNAPGQVLIDYSGTGDGIKRMKEESISEIPMSIAQSITELTRTATGSSEILSTDALSSNLSGVAIAQLQAQAEVPIEELRSSFWEVKKKQGLVLAQFIKLYYHDKAFLRKIRDNTGCECEICDHFYSSEYENSILDVVIEPTRGTRSSITSDISLLDNCLKSGSISFETYIKAYPEGALSNKASLLKQIYEEKTDEIYRLRKELEALKNGKTVDPVSIV